MGVAVIAFSTGAFAQSNGSFTNQQGNGNRLDILQSGSGNKAGLSSSQVIYQENQSVGAGNSLVVNQTGNNNTVGQAFFYGTAVDANQTGSKNTLQLDQTGNGNSIAYRQFGNNNGTRNAEGAPVDARRFQLNDNYGAQSGNQTGLWNYVRQAGNNGNVKIDQESRGSASSNGVIAFQGGLAGGQYIRLQQTTTATTSGADNLAYFDQRSQGTSVVADIKQTNNGPSYNLSDIRQYGSNLTVNGTQSGSGLDLFVQQNGDQNRVNSTQTARDSMVKVYQTNTGGSENIVTAFQNDGSGHLLSVTQSGFGHSVTSSQGGTGQIALIDQNGDNNTYIGVQTGSYNSATVSQGLNMNTAVVTQNGASNIAMIKQNR